MILLPTWWAPSLLALILLGDVAISLRPVGFIRQCLESVELPQRWWWVLIIIKLLAAAGLIAGIWIPGVAFAANVGVIAYFLCAAIAHIRAGATGTAFRVNCLGMLVLSIALLIFSYL